MPTPPPTSLTDWASFSSYAPADLPKRFRAACDLLGIERREALATALQLFVDNPAPPKGQLRDWTPFSSYAPVDLQVRFRAVCEDLDIQVREGLTAAMLLFVRKHPVAKLLKRVEGG